MFLLYVGVFDKLLVPLVSRPLGVLMMCAMVLKRKVVLVDVVDLVGVLCCVLLDGNGIVGPHC